MKNEIKLRKFTYIFILILGFISCKKSFADETEELRRKVEGMKPIVNIPIYHPAPYSISVFPNNIVEYVGQGWSKTKGQVFYKIDDKKAEKIIGIFGRYNFKEMYGGEYEVAGENIISTISFDYKEDMGKSFFYPKTKTYILFIREIEAILNTKKFRCPFYLKNNKYYGTQDICKYEEEEDNRILKK